MKFLANAVLLSGTLLSTNFEHTAASSRSSPHKTLASTCPARVVNYLTHSLVQQCRTSSWASPQHETTSTPTGTTSVPEDIQSGIIFDATKALKPVKATTTEDTVLESPTVLHEEPSVDNNSSTGSHTAAFLATSSKTDPTETESDVNSPLESGNFLSFEEWKKQNLAKHGQSGDHIGRGRQYPESRKRLPTINTALDSFGDDAEIELNFPGFAPAVTNVQDTLKSEKATEEVAIPTTDTGDSSPKPISRSSDAGKTCKERFNYASFDCAAQFLKSNPEASGSSSVLVENKDSYMLNQCSAKNKFIILQLCDDIAIDTIVLANYEFFSSIFRSFRVSVSDQYPVKLEKWKIIGSYEARNTREVQAFLVENPIIWARYLRIEFLTHYGSEFYCPISLVRVHGTTMLEDYKQHEEAARAEEEEEGIGEREGHSDYEGDSTRPGENANLEGTADSTRPALSAQAHGDSSAADETQKPSKLAQNHTALLTSSTTLTVDASPTSPLNSAQDQGSNVINLLFASSSLCPIPEESSVRNQNSAITSTPSVDLPDHTDCEAPESTDSDSRKPRSSPTSTQHSTANRSLPLSSATNPTGTRSLINKTSTINSDSSKSAGSITQPSPANPTIQESFFKSVQKRLQMLESNSSLSLQYIEDQSRILRDAFTKVEQRQLTKTNGFIDYLNSTVLSELRDFRQQYDQIWQSTVIELEGQREQYQRDMTDMKTRLGILAEEVIFQKRLSILQNILVLLCLGLVLFSRRGVNNYLELPLVQNVMARSHSFRFGTSVDESPTESPYATRPNSADFPQKPSLKVVGSHSRATSNDSTKAASSPVVDHTPVSPRSRANRKGSESSDAGHEERASSPSPSFSALERPGTSPPAFTSSVENNGASLQQGGWKSRVPSGGQLQDKFSL